MKYNLLCDVKAKCGYEEYVNYSQINVYVEVLDYHGTNYGNGKELFIQIEDAEPEFIDIRYDRNYNRMKEHLYIQEFLKSYAHNSFLFEIIKILTVKIYE